MINTSSETARLTLNVPEVAKLAGVSIDSIYEGARAGTVPGVIRLGRRLLFAKAAIDRWLAGEAA